MSDELDQLCINTLRFLSVDAVQKANSGHPGLPLGAAPMAYTLWTRWLEHNPRNPLWFNRDRFVLSPMGQQSAGPSRARAYAGRGNHHRTAGPGVRQRGRHGDWRSPTRGTLQSSRSRGDRSPLLCHRQRRRPDGRRRVRGGLARRPSQAGQAHLPVRRQPRHARRFEAYGWHTVSVVDGNDVAAIAAALQAARAEAARPSLILVRTHIGYGSPEQDSIKAHGSPLGVDDVRKTKRQLGWPSEPDFLILGAALAHFREALVHGALGEKAWNDRMTAYAQAYPDLSQELRCRLRDELPPGWDTGIPTFPADAKGIATRVASGKVMNAIAPRLPALIGGSADLDPSTHTALQGLGDFNPPSGKGDDMQGSAGGGWGRVGRNLHFGVREHAMGAIVNGLATHGGFVPYGSTFFIFSDYMRPPIRLAALMGLHAAWRVALETRGRPLVLVLSRQDLPTLDRSRYAPAERLQGQGVAVRCVSMPSWELFDALPQFERDAVLPPSLDARLAVEAGVAQGWRRYVGAGGDVLSVERFGASAPSEVRLREYGFSVEEVCRRALALRR